MRRVPLVLLTVGCGSDAATCVALPCAPPFAIEATVTRGDTGAPIADAHLSLSGASSASVGCSSAGVCTVIGGPGTYQLDISAPGYQTVRRQIVVPGSSPACGCASVSLQRLTVALPAG